MNSGASCCGKCPLLRHIIPIKVPCAASQPRGSSTSGRARRLRFPPARDKAACARFRLARKQMRDRRCTSGQRAPADVIARPAEPQPKDADRATCTFHSLRATFSSLVVQKLRPTDVSCPQARFARPLSAFAHILYGLRHLSPEITVVLVCHALRLAITRPPFDVRSLLGFPQWSWWGLFVYYAIFTPLWIAAGHLVICADCYCTASRLWHHEGGTLPSSGSSVVDDPCLDS